LPLVLPPSVLGFYLLVAFSPENENITFLLAVGGVSVIEGAKFLSAAAVYEGKDS
jgi:alcohol dehydrogenase YqhD (iron-dependent ADH family)